MRSPLPFPCVPDRPYKILLVQVGTLSFSHPSFGVPVLFIYLLLTEGETTGRGATRGTPQAYSRGGKETGKEGPRHEKCVLGMQSVQGG